MCHIFQRKSLSHNKYKAKGVLSIEVALVLPVFLMAMMSLISIIFVLRIDMKIRETIYEEAKYAAIFNSVDEGYGLDGIKARILYKINKIGGTAFIDQEAGGLDFSQSEFSNPEIINITVIYNVKLPFDLLRIFSYSFTERAVMHTWIGYIDGLNSHYRDDSIVYIVENSEVYHISKECSHIKLNIRVVDGDSVSLIRNDNGEKYKSCRLCHASKNNSELYITSDGDKYHSTLSCSGLKRSYKAVPKYTVPDRRVCYRCGY